MFSKLRHRAEFYLRQPIIRYFVMASLIVLLELMTFAGMNSLFGISYLIATPGSMAVGFVLNWYFSKVYVFHGSRHPPHIEFSLMLVTTLIGVGIQLLVTTICIKHFHLLPIIGKFFAIVVTFFWNYWVRKRYIFHTTQTEEA